MIVIMSKKATEANSDVIAQIINDAGFMPKFIQGETQVTIHAVGKNVNISEDLLMSKPNVEKVIRVSTPWKLASLDYQGKTTITVSRRISGENVQVNFNDKEVVMIAGPCAIESKDQTTRAAGHIAGLGGKVLRGGAFKPRSNPHDFRGLGEEGLKIGRQAADEHKLLFVTEVMSTEQVPLVAEYADILQIGMRNMKNYCLLEAVGRLNMPVLLKRGEGATLDDFLMSAEYILTEQKQPQVLLCVRGIKTFENKYTRNTVDIFAAQTLKKLTWLPVIVDPSHMIGNRDDILAACQASLFLGSSGYLVETHPYPERALCDGGQSLHLHQFSELYWNLKHLAPVAGKILI